MTKQNATPEDLAKQVILKIKDAKISHSIPSQDILSNLFRTLFYTSLKTEEGQHIRVTITLIDPKNPDPAPPSYIQADRWNIVRFDKDILFTVKNLVKLSKAADVWSSSLAVYYNSNNELLIWGMIDQAVHHQSFLVYERESKPEQPGLIQSTITGIGGLIVLFDYELIASLKQDVLISKYIDVFNYGELKDIFKQNTSELKSNLKAYIERELPNYIEENTEKLEKHIKEWEKYIEDVLKQSLARILLRIQNYQHGGALLITNDFESDLDIKYPINYNRVSDAINRLAQLTVAHEFYSKKILDEYLDTDATTPVPADLYLDQSWAEFEKRDTKNELKGAIRFTASLSCVDGLVLLDKNLNVKGFGTVIRIGELPNIVYNSKLARINESKLNKVSPNSYGTRHRSMFSYCWNHRGSIGFVISQDGDVRAVTRIGNKLIMWENIKVQQFIGSKKLAKPLVKSV